MKDSRVRMRYWILSRRYKIPTTINYINIPVEWSLNYNYQAIVEDEGQLFRVTRFVTPWSLGVSITETATKSGDNSREIPRKSLKRTVNTGKYLAVPWTLAFVLVVLSRCSNSSLVLCWQHLPPLIFALHGCLSRNSMDYSVYKPISYPRMCVLYYPCL